MLGVVVEFSNSQDCDNQSQNNDYQSHDDKENLLISFDDENQQNKVLNQKDNESQFDYSKNDYSHFDYATTDRSLFKDRSKSSLNLSRQTSRQALNRNQLDSLTRSSSSFNKSHLGGSTYNTQYQKPTNQSFIIQQLQNKDQLLQSVTNRSRVGNHTKNKSSLSSISQYSKDSKSITRLSFQKLSNAPSDAARAKLKTSLINQGLVQNHVNLSNQQALQTQMTLQKKDLTLRISLLKKSLIQTQKQLRQQTNENKQIQEELTKLNLVLETKSDKKVPLSKEIAGLRKDVRLLERESEEIKICKEGIMSEMRNERKLVDAISQMVISMKKQIYEVKKDKEKFSVMIKQDYKVIESLAKRKDVLDGDEKSNTMDQKPLSPNIHQKNRSGKSSNNSSTKKQLLHISTQSNHQVKFSNFNSPLLRGTGVDNRSMPSEADNDGGSKAAFHLLGGIQEGEGWQQYVKVKTDLDDTIKDLDLKLNRVLAKQEFDYLKGYNIYVKRKEKELRDLIKKLSDKNQNATFKDEKMLNMENTITNIRDEQTKMERQRQEMREKIKFWKNKAEMAESDKAFLYGQTVETKKKNQLLKVAVGRLQVEIGKYNEQNEMKLKLEGEIQKSQFFITDLLQAVEPSKKNSPRLNYNSSSNPFDSSQIHDISTMQHSLLEPSQVLLTATNRLQKASLKRFQSNSVSRYANIPTDNIKFSKFLDLLFKSKMTQDEIREEIKKYVQALETNYTQVIQELKDKNEKLNRQLKLQRTDKVNQVTEKTEFEALFVECIEDVRKDVMKRRLKSEILSRRKFVSQSMVMDKANDDDAREFEESLMKLAQLAKNRIKFTDFTNKDRFNILDLFVNNEKTLITIYEALFPHRQNISQTTVNFKPLQDPSQHSMARYGGLSGYQSNAPSTSSARMKSQINPNEFLLDMLSPQSSHDLNQSAIQQDISGNMMFIKENHQQQLGMLDISLQKEQSQKIRLPILNSKQQQQLNEGYNTSKASYTFRNSLVKI